MNLLLLEPGDFIDENRVQLQGRRLQHMQDVHGVTTGDTLKAGVLNGSMGTARILQLSQTLAELEVSLDKAPPPPLPITLLLALPRPKMLRRVLQTVATMGVKQLYLINSWRVEKSYWQSPFLSEHAIREQLLLGLEQGCDTLLPEVHIRQRFKPFVEDELPGLVAGNMALVAHPSGEMPCPTSVQDNLVLALGPEGGFIDYEIQKFQETGFDAVTLGARILRVETAIPAILGRLFQ
ncbi:16S rRNA (uracil(1498)-N(3))-methyltransferase [Porticoccus litoralis]|uniref:Ribosomal RNA small subunit methyltransferase E n=1 Tax=Porticoccus litoralis TaxID=434086 RepID=A0AAW8B216_9GAMM|nr:16S rRNA (uracil(1498)-N(3))-methyltransferase [Porticoccus litoralis]MDP1519836.1 16S rRNA (uracil(1498)-N(3))-methyltransferase [Porticoccus litoralis]